jgi:glutamyl-tRNA synthetase
MRIIQGAQDRIKVAGDILDYSSFFLSCDQLSYDEKDFEKRIRKPPEAARLLAEFKGRLATVEHFDPPELERLLQAFVAEQGIEVGQIIHALRVAVTGKAIGFGVFDSLAILGREECLARIDRALARSGQ